MDLVHTFLGASVVRQTTTFNIDIVDDSINEQVEQFIVLVDVIDIAPSAGTYNPDESERLFATVTIQIDTNNPDSEFFSF